MPLPADVLPQLLHGSSVSGQSEAQRGLWDLREGTGEVLLVCVCVCERERASQHSGKDAVYHDNAAGVVCQCERGLTGALVPK